MSLTTVLERRREARIPNWAGIIPRADRFSVDAPISVFTEHGATLFCRIQDISRSGVRLRLSRRAPLQHGQIVSLDLLGAGPVPAVVTRRNGKEMALEFVTPLAHTFVVSTAMYYASRYTYRAVDDETSKIEVSNSGAVGAKFAMGVAFIIGTFSAVTVMLTS